MAPLSGGNTTVPQELCEVAVKSLAAECSKSAGDPGDPNLCTVSQKASRRGRAWLTDLLQYSDVIDGGQPMG